MVHFAGFVLGLAFPLWAFTGPCGVAARTPGEGEPRVIGSPRPIVAAPGDDVILPCHLEPRFNVEGLTVEWSRPDVKPDPADRLSRAEYVHVYRDRNEFVDMKMQSYVERTALFADGLKRGNISLRIANVTLADAGRYKCFIPKLKSSVTEAIVLLVVEPNSGESRTTETPLSSSDLPTAEPKEETGVEGARSRLGVGFAAVVVCVLLVLGAAAGCALKFKLQDPNLPKYNVAPNKPPSV